MIKINYKMISLLISIISVYNFCSADLIAGSKQISGKVIYSDNKSPVSEGTVKIFKINGTDGRGSVIDKVSIDKSGNFIFTLPIKLNQTDGIKIMAYPNDYDNIEPPYHPSTVEISIKSIKESITIEVERGKVTEKINSAGKTEASLLQNFPNPFNPATVIRFNLPKNENVSLKIYNMNGEVIATLIENKNLESGFKEFQFDAGNLPSGIYIYSLTAGNYTETRKMMLLK